MASRLRPLAATRPHARTSGRARRGPPRRATGFMRSSSRASWHAQSCWWPCPWASATRPPAPGGGRPRCHQCERMRPGRAGCPPYRRAPSSWGRSRSVGCPTRRPPASAGSSPHVRSMLGRSCWWHSHWRAGQMWRRCVRPCASPRAAPHAPAATWPPWRLPAACDLCPRRRPRRRSCPPQTSPCRLRPAALERPAPARRTSRPLSTATP
mmetsp:Transcript_109992/g.350826  ORF Transcript_109992/g.350826 Transcript_109992/m.350826 type:complete len:210 (-) Transcript_109992:663-1292(-)